MRLRRKFYGLIRIAVAILLMGSLTGCVTTIISGAIDVVTLPVRVVGAGINAVVPSQREADRKRGKRERKAEDAQRKAAKKVAREPERTPRADR